MGSNRSGTGGRTGRRFHGGVFAAGAVMMPAGYEVAGLQPVPHHTLTGVGLTAAGVVLAGLPGWLAARPGKGSAAQVGRWDRHPRRHDGMASRTDIWRTSSGWAMRRKAAVVRPSLRHERWWVRWRAPLTSYATPLCTVGRQTV